MSSPSALLGDLLALPNIVAQLRSSVLQLAMSGRLQTADSGDEPAETILATIRREREVLLRSGAVRKVPPTAPSDYSIPYAPEKWVWVPLGDVVLVVRGASPRPKGDPRYFSKARTSYRWVKISDLRKHGDGTTLWDTDEFLTEEGTKHSVFVEKGTLVLTNSATIGVPIFMGVGGYIHDGFLAFPHFPKQLDPRFFFYLLRTLTVRLEAQARGLAQMNLNSEIVRNMVIGLPPLAEQKRIVAKVDQLMALCDDLEAKQTKKRALATQSTRSALTALTSAETAEDLSTAWHRVVKNFNLTTSDSAAINGLRSAILGLAVRGQLVRDCPRTGGGAPHGPLPQGWHWVKMSEAGDLKLGRQRAPQHHVGPNMRPYLRVANVFEARLDLSDVMEMNFEPEEAERFELRPNDVLLNEGQSTELVGRPAIYRGEIPGVCFQNTLIRFRPSKLVIPEYALTVFRAYMRTGRFQREAQQTTNIAHLSLGRLATVEFPLPPLPEQKRIVAKVDHLMSLLDDLEAKLRKQEETATCLAESLAAAVTAS